MLEMNSKKNSQELDLLRSAVGRLAHELESLKGELKRLLEEAPPRQKEKQQPLKTETKEAHPRQGNFTPDDVSIEKMFYFGNKS